MQAPVWNEVQGPLMPCGHHATRIVGTNDMGDPVDFVQDMDHPVTGEKCCQECYRVAMEKATAHWTLDDVTRAFHLR